MYSFRARMVQHQAILDCEEQLGKTLGRKGRFVVTWYILLITVVCIILSHEFALSYVQRTYVYKNILIILFLFIVSCSPSQLLKDVVPNHHMLQYLQYIFVIPLH